MRSTFLVFLSCCLLFLHCAPPPNGTCTSPADCLGDEVCVSGKCSPAGTCANNGDCTGNQICLDKKCQNNIPSGCTKNTDCAK